MLRTLGADVRPCPVVPWSDDNNYNHQVTQRLHYMPPYISKITYIC